MEEDDFDAQLRALADKPLALGAPTVHLLMGYAFSACGRPLGRINSEKVNRSNVLRHVTCRRCLHSIINQSTARLDALAKEKSDAKR